MNNKIKTYKIIVDSKPFANIRGSTPVEVAKKAASKILGNSLNRASFSIVEAKTGKFRHYDAKRENLVRPYHKNGKLVKYRIVVKKLGKQIGGTYPPNLEEGSDDPIFTFFPREKYKINIQTYTNLDIVINISSNSKWSPICIRFFVKDKKNLYIDQLDQCDSNTGSSNLYKIIEYAKYLKGINLIDKITLQDESEIIKVPNDFNMELRINLWLLSILCKGISWYNSFGFVSTKFEEEVKHNSSLLLLNFEDFLNKCKMNNDSKKESLLLTYKNKNKNVQELFEEIKSKLKQSIDLDTLLDITILLEYIKSCEIIRYNKYLELIL
jgi:hypothetical protein